MDDSLKALVISRGGRGLPFAHLLWAGGVDVVYFSPLDEQKGQVSEDGMIHAKSWRPFISSVHFIVCDDPVIARKCLHAVGARKKAINPKVLFPIDVSAPTVVPVRRRKWWKFWSE